MNAAEAIYDTLDRFTGSSYNTRMFETLRGEGQFWPTNGWKLHSDRPQYDMEQEIAIFKAVQRACQCQGSPADRWMVVERELLQLAHEYASDV